MGQRSFYAPLPSDPVPFRDALILSRSLPVHSSLSLRQSHHTSLRALCGAARIVRDPQRWCTLYAFFVRNWSSAASIASVVAGFVRWRGTRYLARLLRGSFGCPGVVLEGSIAC